MWGKIIFDEIDHLSPTEEGNLQQQSLFTEDGQSAQEERDRIEAAKFSFLLATPIVAAGAILIKALKGASNTSLPLTL